MRKQFKLAARFRSKKPRQGAQGAEEEGQGGEIEADPFQPARPDAETFRVGVQLSACVLRKKVCFSI